jgi:hypothetical protein
MKLITILILYNEQSKELLDSFKESTIENVFDKDEINFAEIEVDENNLIFDKKLLEGLDSKYLYVVNVIDKCEFNQIIINILKETKADIIYNTYLIEDEQGEITIPDENQLMKSYYNKIIKISHLQDLIYYDTTFYDEVIYTISLEKDIIIQKTPFLYYTLKHNGQSLRNFDDEKIDDSINYIIDGIEYNANLQLKSIIPLAKEYLTTRELYDLNYSGSVNIPIILSILDNNKSLRMVQKIFLGAYSIEEIINGELIYQDIEDKIDMKLYTKLLYHMIQNPNPPKLNIIVKSKSNLNNFIQENVTIPYKIYYINDFKEEKDIDKLKYEYTWIVNDKVEKICLIDLSIQTNDCEFILFGQEKDKIRTVSEVESLSTENMWVKTDILKKQKTLDFKLENDKDNIMFNIRKIYK